MKKLIGIALIVCMLFSILLCGCGGKDNGVTGNGSLLQTDDSPRTARFKDGQITYYETPKKEILSGDYAVEKDGWIYYQSNSKTLEKMKNDGTGKATLCVGEPREIFIVGDWIYFVDDGIFKVRTDGKDLMRLTAMYPETMTIEGDWVYFVGEESFIYRLKADGTNGDNPSILSDGPTARDFVVDGDYMYYVKDTGKETTVINGVKTTDETYTGIYKMKTDGTGKTLLANEKADTGVYKNGEWLYYSYYNITNKVSSQFKIRLDGTEKTSTDDGSIFGMVYKDWFYFRDANDLSSLYRMRLNGTEKTKIIDNNPTRWKFKNDYIYYVSYPNDKFNLMKMKTDGSEIKQLADDIAGYMTLVGDWIYCSGHTRNYMFSTDGTERDVLASPQAVNK